jgi:hypothetical protein
MLKKLTCLFVCAGMLLASAPLKGFAQTMAPHESAGSGQDVKDAQAKPKSDLRIAIGDLTTKSRFDLMTEPNVKRLEREGPNPQNTARRDPAFTKNQKILVYSVVAGLIVLAVVLGIKTGKGGHTFCDSDPTDPDCLLP